MEKQEKVTKEPKENKKKRKRKVSIFTIFLWLFLIIVMSIITIGTFSQKNAIEVTDNNWNIQLVMYDRSSDTPDQAITDFTWNATSEKEKRQLVMQINYACTTGKEYQPGEIVVEIPGIGKDSFSEFYRNATVSNYSYASWLANNVVIAADKENSSEKQYDWSYYYNEEQNIYTFTNNMVVAENEHFEGTIQILYDLYPRLKIQTDLEYQAKIKENIQAAEIIAMESNVCNFHYTSTKESYTLEKIATAAAKADYSKIEDVLDDYYWVKYNFSVDSQEGIIKAFDENNNRIAHITYSKIFSCIKEELPEDCVLYDENLNKIEPQEGNAYYYLNSSNGTPYIDYYVGYPKSKYQEGESVTNTAELWGRYEDEKEMQKLTEDDITVSLAEFDFEYHGSLYGISKTTPKAYVSDRKYLSAIKSEEGEDVDWYLEDIIAFYTDSIMDVEMGDDLLYIARESGGITKLEDNEYHFTSVEIPVFYTYDKYSGEQGDSLVGYEWELQVRYKDTSQYINYQTGITEETSKTIIFDDENIVGIKVVIKNLDKTLYNGNDSIKVGTNIHTQDCIAGDVYNFCYLQVYHKDEEGNRTLVNEPTLDSYAPYASLEIAEYDQATYGTYMQRGYEYLIIHYGYFDIWAEKIRK